MTILERFLKYISIDTTSDSNSNETPSTKKQYDFPLIYSLLKALTGSFLAAILDGKNPLIKVNKIEIVISIKQSVPELYILVSSSTWSSNLSETCPDDTTVNFLSPDFSSSFA